MVDDKRSLHLPHDLIIEILLRLPPKILCKFRCVSKLWFDLLTNDQEFVSRRMEMYKKKPILLTRRYILDENGEMSKDKATIELKSVDMEGNVTDRFKTVIKGIIHIFISCGPLAIIFCMDCLYICNPSFHELVPVPYRSRNHIGIVGFGYLPISGEYKVVHVYERIYSYRDIVCEVLTFRNIQDIKHGSWKRTIGSCPRSVATEKHSLCINGCVFWARSSGGKDRSILRFDLEKEEFSIIKYPEHDPGTYGFMEFTGIKGSLCVVGCSMETSRMDVWMFDRSENLWVMECCIGLFPFPVEFLISSDCECDEILMHTENKGIISYNIKNQTSRRVKYFEGVRSYNRPCLYHYTSSPLCKNTCGQ